MLQRGPGGPGRDEPGGFGAWLDGFADRHRAAALIALVTVVVGVLACGGLAIFLILTEPSTMCACTVSSP